LFSEFIFPRFFVSIRGVWARQWRRNDLIFPASSRLPKKSYEHRVETGRAPSHPLKWVF